MPHLGLDVSLASAEAMPEPFLVSNAAAAMPQVVLDDDIMGPIVNVPHGKLTFRVEPLPNEFARVVFDSECESGGGVLAEGLRADAAQDLKAYLDRALPQTLNPVDPAHAIDVSQTFIMARTLEGRALSLASNIEAAETNNARVNIESMRERLSGILRDLAKARVRAESVTGIPIQQRDKFTIEIVQKEVPNRETIRRTLHALLLAGAIATGTELGAKGSPHAMDSRAFHPRLAMTPEAADLARLQVQDEARRVLGARNGAESENTLPKEPNPNLMMVAAMGLLAVGAKPAKRVAEKVAETLNQAASERDARLKNKEAQS